MAEDYEYLGYRVSIGRFGFLFTANAVRPDLPPDEHTPFGCPAMDVTGGLMHDGFASLTLAGCRRRVERAVRVVRACP